MLAALSDIEICGLLQESHYANGLKGRWRALRQNVKKHGWQYPSWRLGQFLKDTLDRLAARAVNQREVDDVLRHAFPDRPRTLSETASRHQIPLQKFTNLNHSAASEALTRLNVDLGIVIGTRILRRSTFSVPRRGCLNLHKGKVPEYRGMPPGFWELYDGQTTAGVTVHFVDEGLDTGDVVGEDIVNILPSDTPVTLRRKLDGCGNKLLTRCVVDIARGQYTRRAQPSGSCKARKSPSLQEQRALERKLGLGSSIVFPWKYIGKTILQLFLYYCGPFSLVRTLRRVGRHRRMCVVLYHRVNDLNQDRLTTSVQRFAEQMVALRKYYTPLTTSGLVEILRDSKYVPAHGVAVHFDDCYRDVLTDAAPILSEIGWAGCCFVTSGFVGTQRVFDHDKGTPFRMENFKTDDLLILVKMGFEIGAHTVNHVDLGSCSYETATTELVESRQQLQHMLSASVRFFSYPFGRLHNFREELQTTARLAGYEAVFSAYGGGIDPQFHLYELPRIPINGQYRALDMLLEVEGLSLDTLRRRRLISKWRRARAKRPFSTDALPSPEQSSRV